AGAATPNANTATGTTESLLRMNLCALLFEARDEPRRACLVALPHFVDEGDRVLEQRNLGLEVFQEALLRRLAAWLCFDGRAAFADGLIDDRQVFFERRGRLRVERTLAGTGDALEAGDGVLIVLLGEP